ncbi:hypothetical protein [Lutimonas vermicola]|uniref:DUF1700 domain-containing protein n=1 Tax=Lutimonas vermicola TaxID=414288 RepID=A0ABU9L1K0_9FLAO
MKEDKKIDKLIRESLKIEQPSADFTDKIMNQIEMADAKQEEALGSLLKKNALESPSLNFTARVMAEVEKVSVKVADKPIISKKAWAFIMMFVASIFVYVLLTGEKNAAASQAIDGTMKKVDNLLSNSMTFDLPAILTSPLFGLSFFALSSLLFLDYFIKNRKLSVNI